MAAELDPNVMRVYKQLAPQPAMSELPEMFAENSKFKKEGDVLWRDPKTMERVHFHIFAFNTCLLLCAKNGSKWSLRFLIRTSVGITVRHTNGQSNFTLTARARDFDFGTLSAAEAAEWATLLRELGKKKKDESKKKKEVVDPLVGGLLDGLKKGLQFDDDDVNNPYMSSVKVAPSSASHDDDKEDQEDSDAESSEDVPTTKKSTKKEKKAKKAKKAKAALIADDGDDDDDDPFASLANRKGSGATGGATNGTTNAASQSNDLFSFFDASAPASNAPAPAPLAAAASPNVSGGLPADVWAALNGQPTSSSTVLPTSSAPSMAMPMSTAPMTGANVRPNYNIALAPPMGAQPMMAQPPMGWGMGQQPAHQPMMSQPMMGQPSLQQQPQQMFAAAPPQQSVQQAPQQTLGGGLDAFFS